MTRKRKSPGAAGIAPKGKDNSTETADTANSQLKQGLEPKLASLKNSGFASEFGGIIPSLELPAIKELEKHGHWVCYQKGSRAFCI